MRFWKRLVLTASYVTACPFLSTPSSDNDLVGLAKYLPCVGVLVGCFLAIEYWLLLLFGSDTLVCSLVLTISWIVITGGIHLDGLMDTADGIFSHRSRERMLEIMHDPRVGNFGAVSGFCLVLVKLVALSKLPFLPTVAALLTVPLWARWTAVLAIGGYPYLRQSGMGKIWHDSMRVPSDLILSSVVPLLISIGICHFFGQPIYSLISIFTISTGVLTAFLINRILKGQTGDTYGAIIETAEAGGLLLSAIISNLFFVQ